MSIYYCLMLSFDVLVKLNQYHDSISKVLNTYNPISTNNLSNGMVILKKSKFLSTCIFLEEQYNILILTIGYTLYAKPMHKKTYQTNILKIIGLFTLT